MRTGEKVLERHKSLNRTNDNMELNIHSCFVGYQVI